MRIEKSDSSQSPKTVWVDGEPMDQDTFHRFCSEQRINGARLVNYASVRAAPKSSAVATDQSTVCAAPKLEIDHHE